MSPYKKKRHPVKIDNEIHNLQLLGDLLFPGIYFAYLCPGQLVPMRLILMQHTVHLGSKIPDQLDQTNPRSMT